jgi:hypothetical protein
MVVLVIHQHGIFAFEGESEPPTAAHGYRPVSFQLATQWMQPPAGCVHISCRLSIIQSEKLLSEPLGMDGLDFRFRARPEELFDSFMPEAPDHLV